MVFKVRGIWYMASTVEFVEYVCDQASGAGSIAYKKMFGEYSIYCNAKA